MNVIKTRLFTDGLLFINKERNRVWVFQTEANKIQNMTCDDIAIRAQVIKARAMEIWNMLQGRFL